MSEFIIHTTEPKPELVIRRSHPKIKKHSHCFGRGYDGWRKDGTPIPCNCSMGLILRNWLKHFGIRTDMHQIKFNEESIIVS